MSFRSAEKTLALSPTNARFGLMLLLVLAGVGLSKGASAASDAIVDCDRLKTSLRSLEVPATDLDSTESDVKTAASAITTPVLLLGPRASSISREVFAALPIDRLDEDGTELDASNSVSESGDAAPSTPPIVKHPLMTEPLQSAQDEQPALSPFYLPRFQQQMYRTDI